MKVSSNNMAHAQGYEARGVIARFHVMGHFKVGMFTIPVYKFLTLDRGAGQESIGVEFVKPAPVLGDGEGAYLNVEALEEGDIVVHPGLVYRKLVLGWPQGLTAAHFKALQTYKPKDIVVAEKDDDAPAVDLGTIDATTDQVTKTLH